MTKSFLTRIAVLVGIAPIATQFAAAAYNQPVPLANLTGLGASVLNALTQAIGSANGIPLLSGSYAWTGTNYGAFNGSVDVRLFGAKCNGSYDDTSFIQTAVNAGGWVRIPPDCLITSTVNLTVGGTHIVGDGPSWGSVLTSVSAADTFNLACFDCSMERIRIYSTASSPTAGCLIDSTGGFGRVAVKSVRTQGGYSAVCMNNAATTGVLSVEDADIQAPVGDAIYINGASQFLMSNVLEGAGSAATLSGLHVVQAGGLYITNATFGGNKQGIWLNPQQGTAVFDGFFSNVEVDDSQGTVGYSTASVSGASWTGGVVTFNLGSTPSTLATGVSVDIGGVTPSAFNGTYLVTGVSGSSFTAALAGNPGSYSSGGTASVVPSCGVNLDGNIGTLGVTSGIWDMRFSAVRVGYGLGHGVCTMGSFVGNVDFTNFTANVNDLGGLYLLGGNYGIHFGFGQAIGNGVTSNSPGVYVNSGFEYSFDNVLSSRAYPSGGNWGHQSNQTWGFQIASGFSGKLRITASSCGAGNATGCVQNNSTATAVDIERVTGYNPVGVIYPALPSSGSTYTNGSTPATAVLYGGTCSAITIGGIAMPSTCSNLSFPLAPGQQMVVTYTAAPNFYLLVQ